MPIPTRLLKIRFPRLRGHLRRWTARARWAAALGKRLVVWALVAGVVCYVLRDALFARTLARKIEQAAATAGYVVHVGPVQGTYLSDLEITGVQARSSSPEGVLTLALLDEIQLRYSLPQRLLGGGRWLHDVRVRGLQMDLDLTRLRPAADKTPGAAAPAFTPVQGVPHILLEESRLSVTVTGGGADLIGLRGEVHFYPPERTVFRVGCDRASLRLGPGRLDLGELKLAGELDGTVLALTSATVGGDNLVREFRVDLARQDSRVEIEATFGGGTLRVSERTEPDAPEGSLRVEAKDFSMERASLLAGTAQRPTGTLTASLDLRYPSGARDRAHGDVYLDLEDFGWGDFLTDHLHVEGTVDSRRLEVQELELTRASSRVTGHGSLAWDGPALAARADLRLELDRPGEAWPGLAALRSMTGELELQAHGAAPDAPPRVEVGVKDGRLAFTTRMPPLESVTGRLRATPDQLLVEGLRAELGRGPIAVGGRARLESWSLADLDLHVTGQDTLLARSPDIQVRSDLDLRVQGTAQASSVSGDCRLRSVRYTRDVSLRGSGGPRTESFVPFSLENPPLRDLRFNLRLQGDRALHIENNLARANASCTLHLGGTGLAPVMTGRITLEETGTSSAAGAGVVTLPFSTLRIDNGRVDLLQEDPYHPRIFFALSSDIMGYSVNANVTGPMHDPEVVLASSPPLPHEDLVVLITTGNTPAGIGEQGVGEFALLRLGQFYGEQVLSRYFSGALPESGGSVLGRIQITTGQRVSRTGEQTIKGEVSLIDGLDLVGEKDEYGDYNLGVRYTVRFD